MVDYCIQLAPSLDHKVLPLACSYICYKLYQDSVEIKNQHQNILRNLIINSQQTNNFKRSDYFNQKRISSDRIIYSFKGIRFYDYFIDLKNVLTSSIFQSNRLLSLVYNLSAKHSIVKMQSIEQNENLNEDSEQAIQLQLAPLRDRYEQVLTLNHQVRQEVEEITRKTLRKPILNGYIDTKNEARPFNLTVVRQNISFQHFMTKKKNQNKKKEAFQIMRQMLEEKGYKNISTLNQREQKAVMVVRFVNKVENQSGVMEIEDDLSKQRQKIIVKHCIAYIGLICAIEAVYENQMYRLEKIIDLSPVQQPAIQAILHQAPLAYRILFAKGPFWKGDGKESIGIQLIVNSIQSMRYKQNIRVDLLVVMGPLLSQHNDYVKNFGLERTYEEQVDEMIKRLKKKCEKVIPDMQVLIVPSTDDIITYHPIPQPPFDLKTKNLVKFASNPATIRLESSKKQCKINIINYDLITYIDESKCGRSVKQPLLQNIQTYLKQPFIITNTLEDAPFDETNWSGLFNKADFGNVIVMSSQRHPVFAHKVKGNKIFMNIGSLGVDYHAQGKHFMALFSLYEGVGELADRIRVDAITM